jgi:protease-4
MLGVPLRLIWNVVVNLLVLLRLVPRLFRRAPDYVVLEIKGAVDERPQRRTLLRRPRHWTLDAIARVFDEVARDRRVKGVVLQLRDLKLGWARVDSLRGLILGLRQKGKRAVAHLSGAGNAEYAVATACDEIHADESAPLTLIGMTAEALFLKDTLALAGVRAEMLAMGEYKSAAERLTRTDMSPANREATGAIMDQLFARLVDATAQARKLDREKAQAALCGGPYLAQDAVAAGLLDGVLYADELEEKLGKARFVPAVRYYKDRRARLRWRPLLRRRLIAVVSVEGLIARGEATSPLAELAGADAVARALTAVRENRRTAGVVLHVDSRGGDASASDRIWRQVVLTARKKPVIAHLGDVAGSGGYYVVAPCARIVAQPSTLTGSIGVIGGKIVFEELLSRARVKREVIAHGEAAGLYSPMRGFSVEERRRLEAELRAIYDQFVDKVAAGRQRSREDIERVARGRVWTGADAAQRGLVDELGDLRVAIAACENAARRRPGEKFEIVDVRPPARMAGLLRRIVPATAVGNALADLAPFRAARVALLMPFHLKIR